MSYQKLLFPKLRLFINNVKIMNAKENSYVLYFNNDGNENLKLLQKKIYDCLPSEKYNPNNFKFHITILVDNDYDRIISMKEKILQNFIPFELVLDIFCLYEIYPVKLIRVLNANMPNKEGDESINNT